MSKTSAPAAFAVGEHTIPHHVASGIGKASADTGISFRFLMAQAGRESAFRPDAASRTSSAEGLFQFTKQTWLGLLYRFGASLGLESVTREIKRTPEGAMLVDDAETLQRLLDMRKDPGISSMIAGEYAKWNQSWLETALGRDITEIDLCLAHFLGPAGAKHILQARENMPHMPAADIAPEAAAKNPYFFYNADGSSRSVQQFYDKINRALAKPLDRYASFEEHPELVRLLQEQSTRDPAWPFETTQSILPEAAPQMVTNQSTSFPSHDSRNTEQQPASSDGKEAGSILMETRSARIPPRPGYIAKALLSPSPDFTPAWPFEPTPQDTLHPPSSLQHIPIMQDLQNAADPPVLAKAEDRPAKAERVLVGIYDRVAILSTRAKIAPRPEAPQKPDPAQEPNRKYSLDLVLQTVGRALFGSRSG